MITFSFGIKHCFVFVYFLIFLCSSHYSLHLKTLPKLSNSSHCGKKKKTKIKTTQTAYRVLFVCFLGDVLLRAASLPPFWTGVF